MNKTKTFNYNLKSTPIIFLGVFALNNVIVIIASMFSSFRALDDTAFYAIASSFSLFSIAFCSFYHAQLKHGKFIKLYGVKKFNASYIIPTLLIVFGMLFGLGFINGLVANLIEALGGNVSSSSIPLNSVGELLLFTVCYAILPAVFEEYFFRGLILDDLKETKPLSAIMISAILFAIYHGSLTQLFYQFLYGLILGYLAIKSGSIIPGVIAHFLNNFVILLLGYLGVSVNLLNPILIVLGLLFIIGSLAFIYFYKKTDVKSSENVVSAKSFFFPYGLATIMLCLMFCVAQAVNL